MRRRRARAGRAAVAEVPGVRRDGAVGIRRRRPVEVDIQSASEPGEVGDRRLVDRSATSERVVVRDHRGRQGVTIDRDVVDDAGEVVEARPAAPAGEVVAADSPIARVELGVQDLGVVGDSLPVDVQADPRLSVDRRDDVVPRTVVEGGRTADHPAAGLEHPEADSPVVAHVEMPVEAGAGPRARAAVAQDLAAGACGRLDPGLERQLPRGCHSSVGGDIAIGGPGEGRGAIRVAHDRSRRSSGDRRRHRRVVAACVVVDPASGCLTEPPICERAVVDDGIVVRPRRRRRPRRHCAGAADQPHVPVRVVGTDRVAVALARVCVWSTKASLGSSQNVERWVSVWMTAAPSERVIR